MRRTVVTELLSGIALMMFHKNASSLKLSKETNPFCNKNIYKAEVFMDDISRYQGTSQKTFFFFFKLMTSISWKAP